MVKKTVGAGEREDAAFVFHTGAVAGEGAKLVRGTVEGRHQSASSRGGEGDGVGRTATQERVGKEKIRWGKKPDLFSMWRRKSVERVLGHSGPARLRPDN